MGELYSIKSFSGMLYIKILVSLKVFKFTLFDHAPFVPFWQCTQMSISWHFVQAILCVQWLFVLETPKICYVLLCGYLTKSIYLIKIKNAKDVASFLEFVSTSDVQDLLENCGYNMVPKYEDREELVAELCHYLVVDRVRTAIELFKEGLATLGILECMQKHPAAFKKIFCHRERPLTSQDLDQTFLAELDEAGSNNRPKQETAVMNWRDYLQSCEGKLP